MKSFRRSQGHGNGHSHSNSHGQAGPSSGFRPPVPNGPAPAFANPLSRPTERVAPPQKVIKALASHRSTNPQQLSYSKGDFWYVIGERDEWYEALNPITSSRGLVPKKDFEEFAKGGRQHQVGQPTSPTAPSIPDHTRSLSNSHALPSNSPMHSPTAMMGPTSAPTTPGNKRVSPLYAIVQYDFHAERPDELQAKAGEPIVVIAQSNHEWFVAKPIGRLGGPGLIPVTFVEIRDPVTGLRLDSFPTNIPQVEEWKKATAEYKAAAIPLGRLDLPPDQRVTNSPFQAQANSQGGGSAVPSNRASQRTQASQRTRSSAGSATGLGAGPVVGGVAAGVTRHHPEPPHPEPQPAAQAADAEPMLPLGELTELGVPSFHNESGNYWFRLHAVHVPDEPSAPASKLILYRTYEDFYDFQIALLDTFPAEAGRPEHEGEAPPPRILPYMPGPVDEAIDDELTEYRRDELDAYVRALLDLRGADAGYILRHELIRSFFAAKFGDYSEEITREQGMENLQNLAHRMSAMNLGGGHQPHHVNNRSLDQSPMPVSPGPQQSPVVAYNNGHAYGGHGHGHTRSASRDIASSQGHGRQMSGQQVHAPQVGHWANSPGPASGPAFANHHAVPTPPMPSAPAPPPPNPRSGAAFVKIKVYDKATDDLIALRVHPQVTYAELLEKVRARLGPDVNVLSYKVGGTSGSAAAGAQGPTQAIRDDRDMAEWMAVEDQRLILYAEQ
ncbi:hypothetical protein CC85DRAFT_330828 [Cutaneotrichosporon oleaginosum]|uniref:Bud emergence protein 1 n=1 Tax=Cutaneotrichosporon oleaginosum TaxID=879819 RepID=A0A0J1AVN1_9TREE|nr:uncharacterized protein CC85DRAFT_330828 [Cutaneotrichosporon oleaginosum]KLT39344.1 hypothetical protein CC85DRAFT_330828 [Cutaneotrichosporon oleaginosum]TXT08540.1 hypothetical protein COLE_05464 [Cutaneotrichosporon oleaginosum]